MPDVVAAPTGALPHAFLRRLRNMLDVAFAGNFSDDDWTHALGGVHVWVAVADEPVSHASVVDRRISVAGWPLDVAYVEAVATAPERRRCGHASAVMRHVNAIIRTQYAVGVLSTSAHGFYARLGWERWEGSTFVDTPEGRRPTPDDDGGIMILRTPRTPHVQLDGAIVCPWRAGDVW